LPRTDFVPTEVESAEFDLRDREFLRGCVTANSHPSGLLQRPESATFLLTVREAGALGC